MISVLKSKFLHTGFPFSQLTQTLLTGPNASVNNFQEKLTSAWIENEDSSIDWFCSQIAFESLKLKRLEICPKWKIFFGGTLTFSCEHLTCNMWFSLIFFDLYFVLILSQFYLLIKQIRVHCLTYVN